MVETFGQLEMGLVVPRDLPSSDPLGGRAGPAALVAAACGARAALWPSARFAPSLAVALDVPIVNSGNYRLAPVTLVLSFGIRWSAS
jgi:hypothetical protein